MSDETSRQEIAEQPDQSPVAGRHRIQNLDTLRGIAMLGILIINALSFGFPGLLETKSMLTAGVYSTLDYVLAVVSDVFVSQKMLALFAMLFGVGVAVFADRRTGAGQKPWRLTMWRNFLLLCFGIVHVMFWWGDVLLLYAIASPFAFWMRNRRPRSLLFVGTLMVLLPAAAVLFVGPAMMPGAELVHSAWFGSSAQLDDEFTVRQAIGMSAVAFYAVGFFFFNPLGLMLIGIALYRLQIVQGERSSSFYGKLIVAGLSIGIPITVGGLIWQHHTSLNGAWEFVAMARVASAHCQWLWPICR